MRELRGTLDGRQRRVAIALSRYNESITRGLLDGALAALHEAGVAEDRITLAHVPGALELPLAALALARGGHDAVIVLGAVIRGETDHYTYVCAETAAGCTRVALDTGVPVGFGVLTCDTLALAQARAGAPGRNKGREAARAALEQADLLDRIRAGSDTAVRAGRPERAP